MSIESVMSSNHLILCRPLFLLPSIFPSVRVFSNESDFCIRWPKYWSFSFSVSPSNVLIFFRVDWFDLLAVQRTLKSLLQHHSLKASILRCSAFFMVQLSHPYMTTRKTTALTRWTFVWGVWRCLLQGGGPAVWGGCGGEAVFLTPASLPTDTCADPVTTARRPRAWASTSVSAATWSSMSSPSCSRMTPTTLTTSAAPTAGRGRAGWRWDSHPGQ
uniref:LIM zinc finger domain containing 2 n=1 Tax=Ovis aries TaxID=9940 RepID=A0AC11DHD8_SHEEP